MSIVKSRVTDHKSQKKVMGYWLSKRANNEFHELNEIYFYCQVTGYWSQVTKKGYWLSKSEHLKVRKSKSMKV